MLLRTYFKTKPATVSPQNPSLALEQKVLEMEFQTLVISSVLALQTKDLRLTEISSHHLDFLITHIIHHHIHKLCLFQIIRFLKVLKVYLLNFKKL